MNEKNLALPPSSYDLLALFSTLYCVKRRIKVDDGEDSPYNLR
jgi:hypothetical protein